MEGGGRDRDAEGAEKERGAGDDTWLSCTSAAKRN